jgi:hypothetical protein
MDAPHLWISRTGRHRNHLSIIRMKQPLRPQVDR